MSMNILQMDELSLTYLQALYHTKHTCITITISYFISQQTLKIIIIINFKIIVKFIPYFVTIISE